MKRGEQFILTPLTDSPEQIALEQQALIGQMTTFFVHQLRIPLTAAMLNTEHLINHFEHTKAQSKKWLENIQISHERMEQLLQNLLNYARSGSLNLNPVALQIWGVKLEKAVSLLSQSSVIMAIDNQLSSSIYSLHEESLIDSVLNLISNAVQAGASQITVKLFDENKVLCIQVVDDGKGMSEDVKAKAMTPFYTTKGQGTGLGLAVVNAVVKAHNGEISIDSSPAKGCCITINLPNQY